MHPFITSFIGGTLIPEYQFAVLIGICYMVWNFTFGWHALVRQHLTRALFFAFKVVLLDGNFVVSSKGITSVLGEVGDRLSPRAQLTSSFSYPMSFAPAESRFEAQELSNNKVGIVSGTIISAYKFNSTVSASLVAHSTYRPHHSLMSSPWSMLHQQVGVAVGLGDFKTVTAFN